MKQGTLVHSAGPTPSLLTSLLCGGIVETRGSSVALRARPSSWNELRPQHCMLALRLITSVDHRAVPSRQTAADEGASRPFALCGVM